MNEYALMVLTDTLYFYTDHTMRPDTRFKAGWIHISLFIILLFANLTDLIVNTLIYGVSKWFKKRKAK
jgi:hypothetical protein